MVKHILADGRVLDSIEGFVVPTTGATEVVYRLVVDISKKRQEAMNNTKEGKKDARA